MKDALEKKIVCLVQEGKAKTALKKLRKIFKNAPDEELWLKLGEVCGRLGQSNEYLRCCAASIQVNPQYALAYSHAAIVHLAAGKQGDAWHLTQRALTLKSNDADILYNAGAVLRGIERYADAIPYLQQCIAIMPNNAMAHSLIGNCYHVIGDNQQAVYHYKESLKYNPNIEKSLLWLCAHHLGVGDFHEANSCLDKALAISPKSPILQSMQANLFSMMGEKKRAYQIVRKLIDARNVTAVLLNVYFDLCPPYGELSELISLAEDYLRKPTVPSPEKRLLRHALGKAYDSVGDYDRAFEQFKIGNDLYFGKFNLKSYRDMTDKIIDVYSRNYVGNMPKSKTINEAPIFLVGMPRSGSTLIEQILSKHSKVIAGGELPYIDDVVKNLFGGASGRDFRLELIHGLNAHDFEAKANEYMLRMEALSHGSARTTDKMPTNYLFIGLIVQMFPNAKIIHCRRHPLDTCISIYFQDFSISHPYSNSLSDTAYVYGEYDRLMKHWQALLGDNIWEVAYEDVVTDIEDTIRKLLDFCELDWDKSCLEFYMAKRKVATASFNQVNQPIYNKSVGRWKNYESHLEEIKDILQQLI